MHKSHIDEPKGVGIVGKTLLKLLRKDTEDVQKKPRSKRQQGDCGVVVADGVEVISGSTPVVDRAKVIEAKVINDQDNNKKHR